MNNFMKFLKKINVNFEDIPFEESESNTEVSKETKERVVFESDYTIENFHFYIFSFKMLDAHFIVDLPNNLSLPKKYTYDTTMIIEFKDGSKLYTLSDIFYTKSQTEEKAKLEYEKLDNIFKSTSNLNIIFKKLIQML